MCGIVGFLGSDELLLNRLVHSIKHRGPDDSGQYSDGSISLGHTRLSILDLTSAGHQPMVSHDGRYVIAFNGEIYNYRELRSALSKKGCAFRSNTDTEVILASFSEYGTDCFFQFNGIFAFALWDTHERQLYLVRDRFGVKPLYYHQNGRLLYFASESTALYNVPGLLHDFDWNALSVFFRLHYFPAPLTPLQNMKKLEPASYAHFDADGKLVQQRRYWSQSVVTSNCSFSDAITLVKSTFDTAVMRQQVSDRPVGLYLSGGIDSTAILSVMARHSKHPIKTFTASFDYVDEKNKFNIDSELARRTSEFYQTDHTDVRMTAKDFARVAVKAIRRMGEPFYNATALMQYILAQETAKSLPVIFTGDGSDELFGGYPRYQLSRFMSNVRKIPRPVRSAALYVIRMKNPRIADKMTKDDLSRYLSIKVEMESDISRLFSGSWYSDHAARDFIGKRYFSSELFDRDFEQQFMYVDANTWLIDESLMRSDRMTMAWGVEQRVPFLDADLVDLAFSLPSSYKLRGHVGKYVFRKALYDDLPPFIRQPDKRGWFSPIAKWLRTDLKPLVYETLSEGYCDRTRDLFNFREIHGMLDRHMDRKEYNLNMIWALVTFQVWAQSLDTRND